jgi:hypothetical protein
MYLKSFTEVTAVILDSVGGLIGSSQKDDNAISVHGTPNRDTPW